MSRESTITWIIIILGLGLVLTRPAAATGLLGMGSNFGIGFAQTLQGQGLKGGQTGTVSFTKGPNAGTNLSFS